MELPQDSQTNPHWRRGALITGLGVLLGCLALTLFCHAMGLNFSDEGWAENQNAWQENRAALIGSFVGFGLAILIFWLGFFLTIHSKH